MPDVAEFRFAGLFQFCVYIKIILFCFITVNVEKVSNFFFIKSGQTKVKAEILEFFHFHGKEFIIPAGVQCHTVVGKDICLLLCFRHMVNKYTRDFCNTFFICGFNPAVTGEDVIFLVDNDRIDKSKFTQGRTEFQDLFLIVRSGVVCIGY